MFFLSAHLLELVLVSSSSFFDLTNNIECYEKVGGEPLIACVRKDLLVRCVECVKLDTTTKRFRQRARSVRIKH